MNKTAMQVFNAQFAALAMNHEVQPITQGTYGNTGYFEGLLKNTLELQPGEYRLFRDLAKRRVIVHETTLGTIVFFERYTPDAGQPEVIVSNIERAITVLDLCDYSSGAADAAAVAFYIGDPMEGQWNYRAAGFQKFYEHLMRCLKLTPAEQNAAEASEELED